MVGEVAPGGDHCTIAESNCFARLQRKVQLLFSLRKIFRAERICREQSISPGVPPRWIAYVLRVVEYNYRHLFISDGAVKIHPSGAGAPDCLAGNALAASVVASNPCVGFVLCATRLA